MAKVGLNGVPFTVGTHLERKVSQAGVLHLGFADIDFFNNSKAFQVEVEITVPAGKNLLNLAAPPAAAVK